MDSRKSSSQSAPQKQKQRKKRAVTLGVVAAVVIVAGAGFWVWHEQPSFCSAICHTPMSAYVETYDQEPGQPATDKYGNQVSNAAAMMASLHRAQGKTCLDCHVPTIEEQASEGLIWATGNYVDPLYETNLSELVEARGLESGDQFCLNESCHNLTRQQLIEKTDNYARNPHDLRHGEIMCSECHKAHRASVMYCTQCHSDAEVPDGWVSTDEAGLLNMGDQ